MIDYRLYFMTRRGNHIDRFQAIEAASDSEAIEVAKLYIGAWPLELWWRGRKVQDFVPSAA